MDNITSIDQFKTQYNQVVSTFKGHSEVRAKSAELEALQESTVALAECILDNVPQTPVRNYALSGLLGQSYVLVGAIAGVWATKSAAA